MAELVDAADLKSVGRKAVGVQVPPWALFCNSLQKSAEGSKYKAFMLLVLSDAIPREIHVFISVDELKGMF